MQVLGSFWGWFARQLRDNSYPDFCTKIGFRCGFLSEIALLANMLSNVIAKGLIYLKNYHI